MALTHLQSKKKKQKKALSQFFFTPFGVQVDAGEKEKKTSEKREEKVASFFLPSFLSFVRFFRVCEIRRGLDSFFRSGFSRNDRTSEWVGGWLGGKWWRQQPGTYRHCTAPDSK
jgi:hypothetical protein